jgi:hypothetical protein
LIADALVPGIRSSIITPSSSTSAPAIRSVADPLYKYGTALYDEFVMPDSREHVLCQSSLQALATGTVVTPGRVMENDPGVGLRHPLFFSAKLVKNVADIQNRMVPMFLDVLTDATRCSDEEFQALSSGGLSVEARLNHLLWCHQNRIQDKLRTMRAKPHSTWRFGAHLACSSLFIDKEALGAYFTAAANQMASQFEKAEESGLTENMNVTAGFDVGFFVANVHEMSVKSLMAEGKDKKHDVLDVLIALVEDGGRRRFSSALGGTKESSAKGRFIDYMKRKEWKVLMHDIEMTYVPKASSTYQVHGNTRAYVSFRDVTASA